jgi:hypothetical protein
VLRIGDVGLAFLLSLLPLVSVEAYKVLTKTITKKIYAFAVENYLTIDGEDLTVVHKLKPALIVMVSFKLKKQF